MIFSREGGVPPPPHKPSLERRGKKEIVEPSFKHTIFDLL